MALLYYAPGRAHIAEADLVGLGLGHLAGAPESRECLSGPDKGNGCIFRVEEKPKTAMQRLAAKLIPARPAQRIGFYPDEQTWCKCAAGAWWVGWFIDARPGPVDLARLDAIKGGACRLSDGNEWIFPNPINMPVSFLLDEQGECVTASAPRFSPYFDAVEKLRIMICSQEPYPYSEWLQHIMVGLSLNYRISLNEAAALGLFDSESMIEAACIMTDFERLLDSIASAEKKTP